MIECLCKCGSPVPMCTSCGSMALCPNGAELERLRRLEAAVLARADAETAAGFAHEGTDWRPAFERCRVAKQAERAAISEARAAAKAGKERG